ncbi:MAG: transporter [Alphaproteobacteria bacterium]|nr:MAG: transporter [Alphaproteobacteria bacterium]
MIGRPRQICLSAGALCAWLVSAGANAAPQTFNTALPVAQDTFVFRGQFLYRKASDNSSPAGGTVEVRGAVSVLGYGVTGKFAAFAALPYLDKTLARAATGGARIARGASGFGDARLFGRYTAFRDDAPGRTFRIAPFAGIEMPTGDDNDSDGQGRLPAMLQPGSGSWDPFGGVVVTYQALAYQIDAQALYKANTRANGFAFGDEARLDVSVQYRLGPRALGAGSTAFLYGVLEGNLLHHARDAVAGVDDPDSGGTAFFLSPGMQYVTRRWIAEAVVQVPLVQDLNGDALADDIVVRAGFRINF